jgi:hypothetical protein
LKFQYLSRYNTFIVQGDYSLRHLILILFLAGILICTAAIADTFVLKSGKHIEGTVRYEEQDILRIVDSSGIAMNLRKASLDYEAMNRINAVKAEQVSRETIQQPAPTHPAIIYTNASIKTYAKRGGQPFDPKMDVRKAEQEFNRLKEACRAAGQSSPSMRVWNSTTYVVNGKPVTVTGYWAHPDNIAKAKKICAGAIRAEQQLNELRQTR